MIVQCEHCKTKFRLADERISSSGVKVRCSKCAHVFTVVRSGPEARIEANLLDSTASMRPLAPGEATGGALADDLMLPHFGGASLGGAGSGLGGSTGALGATSPGNELVGPPSGLAGPGVVPAWAASPMSPPPTFGNVLPPLPFDVGPPPPVSRPPPGPTPRSPVAATPAGRPPPGHSLPSAPRAFLELEAAASPVPFADLEGSGAFEARTDLAPRPGRAGTEIEPPRGSPATRGPTLLDPLRSPPAARAATELDRATKPSTPAGIRAPTFPPPPEFDPLGGGLPLASIPAPPPPPRVPAADADRFALPRPSDPLASVPPDDMFGGALVGGSAATFGNELGFEPDDGTGGAKLARIELRKGLLGQAGVSTFGAANEQTTRIAARIAQREADSGEEGEPVPSLRRRSMPLVRSALLLVGLFVVVGIALLLRGERRETYVGEPTFVDSVLGAAPPLVDGALKDVYVERARVTSYPLRDPHPRLVVSGRAANGGSDLTADVEVVASVLEGDRVVLQREAPLGAMIPLDVLARAQSAEALDAAWAQAERPTTPWARGQTRPFMVVFAEVPPGIERFTVRVDFRPAKPRLGQR